MFHIPNLQKFFRAFVLLFFAIGLVSIANVRAAEELTRREWKIDDLTREALLYLPADATTKATPVVFAFHGHGGSMRNAARMFHIETLWPEAIVVYMQGVNTPGKLTDPEGRKPGWQHSAGDHNDRDLHFFDAVLASLKKDYKVDSTRIYSTGHSNGGGFTYLLWETRGEQFAAFAPSASLSRSLLQRDEKLWHELTRSLPTPIDETIAKNENYTFKPKPVLHVAGENDPLVKFEWQKLMIEGLRKYNQCGEGNPWNTDKRCTLYKSKTNADALTYIHAGTHAYPADAPEIIVKFFKSYRQ